MPPKSDSEDSKSPTTQQNWLSPVASVGKSRLFVVWAEPRSSVGKKKHPPLIDVLSLQRPLKVTARRSKCGAIVAMIACCGTCVTVRVTLRGSDRVNDGRSDSHHQPLCLYIWDSWGEGRQTVPWEGEEISSLHVSVSIVALVWDPTVGSFLTAQH